jgi:hypothetical protein
MITAGRLPSSSTRPRRIDDDDIFDERGIIRDGKRLRVSVTAMDAAPPQRSAPLSITTGLRLDKEFYPDGQLKSDWVDGSRKPSRKGRRPVDPDEDDGEFEGEDGMRHDALAAHRPGYRVSDAARGVVDAGQALKNAAYEEMVRDNERAWMPDHLRTADTRHTTADAMRPLGVTDSEWQRELGIREMSDAWKTPPPVLDAAAVQNLPAGRYPLSAGEGNPCSIDGAVGTLQREGGYLVCRAKPTIGPTRSGTSAGDAVPRTMSVEDGQRFKDESCRAMVSEQSEAWRTGGHSQRR